MGLVDPTLALLESGLEPFPVGLQPGLGGSHGLGDLRGVRGGGGLMCPALRDALGVIAAFQGLLPHGKLANGALQRVQNRQHFVGTAMAIHSLS